MPNFKSISRESSRNYRAVGIFEPALQPESERTSNNADFNRQPSTDFSPYDRVDFARTSAFLQRAKTPNSPARIVTSPAEWAFCRYWSDRNPFPDYGPPDQGSTMKKFANKVGKHVFGNYLNGPSREPASPSSIGKRSGDSSLTQPPKRPRNDNNARTAEVFPVNGASDIPEGNRSVVSDGKRKMVARTSQSLRSSENRHTSGAVDEYRTTTAQAGLHAHPKRARHKKTGHGPANGGLEQDIDKGSSQETMSKSQFKPPPRRLMSRSGPANDGIEDDELQVTPTGSHSGSVKGRGNTLYNAAMFAPIQSSSSEDELNGMAPPSSRPKLRDQMTQPAKTKHRQASHANFGIKRSLESPDVLQDERPSKRRHEPSSEANIPRTKFAPSAMGSARGRPEAFRVIRAACDPAFTYPAIDSTHEEDDSASSSVCVLLPVENGRNSFLVTDEMGTELEALGWITPNMRRIQVIYYHEDSPIIVIKSASGTDTTTNFAKGSVTIMEFESCQEAKHCVNLFCRMNGSIRTLIRNCESLRANMDEKIKVIHERNTQLAASEKARQTKQSKPLRAQMRADEGLDNAIALHLTHSTPNEDLREHENSDIQQTKRRPQKIQDGRRNLRSTKPKILSSTPPPPERWTEKNPNWVEERGYSIPLVYERTTISATDIERLDEGQFLNDEIISFYAKYLHKKLEARDEPVAKKVYIFSSFFWEKLRSSGYDGVKGWTAKIDVTSFDYIVVPINQSAHWYVAIICNPGALLPEEIAGQDRDAVHPAAIGEENQDPASIQGEGSTKLETVTSSLAHISFDEQQVDDSTVDDVENPKANSSAKKSKAVRRGPGPRKYDPKDPRVIVLDSLDGSHTNVATTLKTYLKNEIKQRKNVDIEVPQQFGMAAKDIPFQTNFTDCGIYLLGYLEEFMKGPYEFTRRILQHESRTWDLNASAMRNQIREVIFGLQCEYRLEVKQRKREKMMALKQKKAKSQTPPTMPQEASPEVANEQAVHNSSATSSSVTNPRQRTSAHALSSPTRHATAAPVFKQRSTTVSPPLARSGQASSRRATIKSSQSPEREPRPKSVTDSMVGNPSQSEESVESASLQQEQAHSSQTVTKTSPVSETSSPSDCDLEILNPNSSMIVNPNQSMESKEGKRSRRQPGSSRHVVNKSARANETSPQSTSPQSANVAITTATSSKSVKSEEAHTAAEQDSTPRVSRSVEVVETDQIESNPGRAFELSLSQCLPRPSDGSSSAADGNYDEKQFLAPIPSSSPPSNSDHVISKTTSERRNDRSKTQSTKVSSNTANVRQNGERSRYWQSPAKASAQHGNSSGHVAATSSLVDEKRTAGGKITNKEEGKRRSKAHDDKGALPKVKTKVADKQSEPSSTIDLTDD